MIPKNLFFLWFGDDPIPKYAENVIRTYKEVNPDYMVKLYLKNIKEIEEEKTKDDILDKARKEAIVNKLKFFPNKPFIILLSVAYRKLIVNKYGGIYLDLDTFPIRPFDDLLLNRDCFTCNKVENKKFIKRDIFFFGAKSGKLDLENATNLFPTRIAKDKDKVLAYKFFNGTIKYGEKVGNSAFQYIDHYCDYTWKPGANRITPCKYDEMLKGFTKEKKK